MSIVFYCGYRFEWQGMYNFVKKHRYAYCNLFNKKTNVNSRVAYKKRCFSDATAAVHVIRRLKRNIHYFASFFVPGRRDLRHSRQYQLKVAKEE